MSEAKQVSSAQRDTILKIVVKQVMGALIAKLPFIASGPIGWLCNIILSKLFAIVLDKTILGVNLYLLEVKTDGNVQELRALIEEVAVIPINEKEKRDELEQKIIESSRNLIKLHDDRSVRDSST